MNEGDPAPSSSSDPHLELADIQGIILFAYAALENACYLHLSFAADARANAWLREVAPLVTCSDRKVGKHEDRINVALTSKGLARLGLGDAELGTLPREVRQGMGHDLRTHVLGDVGPNASSEWELGGPNNPELHALVMLFAKDEAALGALRDREVGRLARFGIVPVHEQLADVRDHEPFGFRDGIEQPHVKGSPRPRAEHVPEVPAGEFVLGYENAYGEIPPALRGEDGTDFGKNGSFLVYRKLEQDVAGFWRAMYERAGVTGDADADERAAIAAAARVVGRWPSGAPVVHYPEGDVKDGKYREDFLFVESDPEGTKCPFGAHIRRANPRDMLGPTPEDSLKAVARHRLLRRGRAYGPPPAARVRDRTKEDGHVRGLVFVAINASIRRQFEFVQQTWVNNPKFAGLYDERDPLVATVHEPDAHYTMPQNPVRKRLLDLPPFVRTRGGAYYFVPGKKALGWIAARRA